jgi:hypothetical protein
MDRKKKNLKLSGRPRRRTSAEVAENERVLSAYHEAGHVVYMLDWNLDFYSVDITLDTKTNTSGTVDGPGIRLIDCHGAERDYELEKRIISHFAGIAAEAKYAGRLRWANGVDDFDSAVELALYRAHCKTENDLEYYLRYTWACANEYFAFPSRWPKVVAVAEALLEKGKLSFEEATNIIKEHHELFQASPEPDAFLRFLIRRSLRWRPWRPRRRRPATEPTATRSIVRSAPLAPLPRLAATDRASHIADTATPARRALLGPQRSGGSKRRE